MCHLGDISDTEYEIKAMKKVYKQCSICGLPKIANDHKICLHCHAINLNKKRKLSTFKKIIQTRKSKHKIWHSKKTRNKISDTLKGHIPWNKNKKCKSLSKENHWNWQEGKTKLVMQIRNSPEYKIWRTKVFEKDNYTCQDCNIRSGFGKAVELNAHHIKQFSVLLKIYNIKTLEQAISCKQLWLIKLGKTLCVDCHNKTKKGRE